MRNDDPRDTWLNQARAPATAWENGLRPSRSSNRMLFLLAAAAATLAAFVTLNGWHYLAGLRSHQERQVAPAKAPNVGATATSRSGERELDPAQSSRVQRFAKCISPSGGATYSDGACPAGTRIGEVVVRPDANLADGMAPEERQASLRRNSAIAQSVYEHERRVAMNVDRSSTECAQLNALIASIDAAARQPQSGLEQDRLKEQRKRARDRQFSLRCG